MKSYKTFAIQLAKDAGNIMLKYFDVGIEKQWKKDKTPVTIADFAVNKLVIKEIQKQYPLHSIIGEEESALKKSEYVWVCDPLDGTMPFSTGIPTFAFSLALVHDGEPILGVIYDPVLKRMFVAEKGKGAYLNGEQIHVSKDKTFENKRIGLESSHVSVYNFDAFRTAMYNNKVRVFTVGSTAYESFFVARGEFIATLYSGNKEWDCAAMKIIIEEAGGKTSDLFGNEQRYDRRIKGFLGSNGILHDQLIEIIAKTVKENNI
ncbi:MAG TPA: inositol monophosphatase [Candidatus Saccharimonadales bacterium]|nr:inositol monophosphatase [Candidatus Saccharimonadales bacterium]